MGIESNEEAMNMMQNLLGSVENRMREAYNKGYKDGFIAGANEAILDVKAQLERNVHNMFKTLNKEE